MIRSRALNDKYGVGTTVRRISATPQTALGSDNGFPWADFCIGAGAMLGFVLLTGGVVAGNRYGRRVPRTRISS